MTKKKSEVLALDMPVLFYPKEIGKTLVEVELDVIETSKHNVLGRWYHSENDADLFLWSDENDNIIKQQIIFSGQVVEWNIIEGVKTGLIFDNEQDLRSFETGEEKEDITKITKEKNKKIKYDKNPLQMAIYQAVDIINAIEVIETDLKNQLYHNYENGKKLAEMSHQEITNKFGQHLSENNHWFKDIFKKVKHWFE